MSTPLLRTKLYIPPARPVLVPRPRLIERLDAGLHRKLTLVSAPAGFGKTTLLSEWISRCERPAAWVSLDEGDNDPARFWSYVVAALQTVQSDVAGVAVGEAALAMLQSPQAPPIEGVLITLINDLAECPVALVLVLDDYHVIDAQRIHNALVFLLDHLPPQVHLVVAGRSDPPLPLSRLRGRSQLTELRTADLRFTFDEAATFLNPVMGLGLSAEDVAALETRTEGWIVGLQMAALSMRRRQDLSGFVGAFTGSHRFILDYLVEEVLDQQAPDIQDFLLQTSILERMTAPLCDVVTGRDDSQTILKQLVRANLFLNPLDDEWRWYRYHHLFADLLRKRLSTAQPDLVSVLHRRASEWYEQNGLIADAINHALAVGDEERVAHLVEKDALAMIHCGELTTLVRWLNALSDEMLRSRPWLCVAHAWMLVYTGHLDAVESRLRDAEGVLGDLGRHVAGHIAAIRGYVADLRGNKFRSAELAREALELLPEEDLKARSVATSLLSYALYWSGDLGAATQASAEATSLCQAVGDSHVAVNILCELARLQIVQGQLHQAVATCRDALHRTQELSGRGWHQLPIVGLIYAHLSYVLCEWNELEAALRHAREGIDLCRRWGQAKALIFGYISLARSLQASGDADGALDAVREARQFMQRVSPWYEAAVKAQQAHLWLAQRNLAAASCWAQESGLDIRQELNLARDHEYLSLARVLIAQGRQQAAGAGGPAGFLHEALGLLTQLMKMAEAAGATGRVIEILVLQAVALHAQGEMDQALTTLGRALTLAQPEGYVRTFIDEGAPMGELLQQVKAQGIAVSYVDKLLKELEKETKNEQRMTEPLPSSSVLRPSSPALGEAEGLIEPLSERELDVLQFLAAGLSNRGIAQELYLSVNTVKTHTKSIYGKLGVHSRTQAVARAQELDLL